MKRKLDFDQPSELKKIKAEAEADFQGTETNLRNTKLRTRVSSFDPNRPSTSIQAASSIFDELEGSPAKLDNQKITPHNRRTSTVFDLFDLSDSQDGKNQIIFIIFYSKIR